MLHVTSGEVGQGSVPIVRFGEAYVNVSTQTGEVHAGDLVTTSRVAGVARRAARAEATYIVGIALDTMTYDTPPAEAAPDGVRYGRVPVALHLGFYDADEAEAASSTVPAVVVPPDEEKVIEKSGIDLMMLFRYILAALVALLALIIALRSFGGSLSQSIISVGRNPLAKSYILSMMFWNTSSKRVRSPTIHSGVGVTSITAPLWLI